MLKDSLKYKFFVERGKGCNIPNVAIIIILLSRSKIESIRNRANSTRKQYIKTENKERCKDQTTGEDPNREWSSMANICI